MTKLDELKANKLLPKSLIKNEHEENRKLLVSILEVIEVSPMQFKSVMRLFDEAFKLGQDDRQKEFDKTLLKVFKKKIKGATVEELDQAKLFIDSVEQVRSEERKRIVNMLNKDLKFQNPTEVLALSTLAFNQLIDMYIIEKFKEVK